MKVNYYYFQISHMDRHNIQNLAIYLQRQLFSVSSIGGLPLETRNHATLLTYSYQATLNGIHANAVYEALNNYSVNVMAGGHIYIMNLFPGQQKPKQYLMVNTIFFSLHPNINLFLCVGELRGLQRPFVCV